MSPRTESQRSASRLNGSKSLGPVTESGRLASSRNASKHGFSGSGKSLPPDMELELASEITLFSTQFHPSSPYEHELIRRAALGNLRSRRISDALNSLIDDRTRNAFQLWDEARSEEIANLANLLPADPASATRKLRQTAEGCDHLGDLWEVLAHSLETEGSLTPDQSLRALHLLGLSAPPDTTSPQPLQAFWNDLLALQSDDTPEADRAELRSALLNDIRSEVSALETEGARLWETQDLPSRQSAPLRAAFDASPESTRLHRYLASAERLRRQSLDELHRLRKSQHIPNPKPTRIDDFDDVLASVCPQPNEPEPPAPPRLSPRSMARRARLLDPVSESYLPVSIGRYS